MGLSQDYKKKIKESMEMDKGGRLHAIADKAKSVNAPVLIIGLGGSGMDSLLVTKKLIYDMIEREKKADGKYADKPKNIEYLGIDTDEGYKDKKYQGLGLNYNAGEVQIYTMPHVQPVLEHPDLLPEYINCWLDTSIKTEQVINGAGAVRQLGRLLLMQNIDKVTNILQDKIRKVTVGYPADVALEVFIISGISGGTGSGTFIDVPYLVRAISAQVSNRPVQIFGLLFLPDVNANKTGVTEVVKNSLYSNGFAALKELDYLMNIEQVGDSFEQNYGPTLKVGMRGSKPAKPYDICLLLSSKNKNGALMATGNEGYEMVTHVVAETIFNFVLGDTGKNRPGDFSINSWLANEVRNIQTYQTMLGNQRHPVSYVYSIAGASSAKLPMDDVMSYLAYRMYQEVQNFWDQRPEDKDIDAVEKFFHLSKKIINAESRAGLPQVNTAQFTKRIVKENHAQVVQQYEVILKKQKSMLVANLEQMEARLQEALDNEDNIINQYFKDLEKGPVFAQQCLYSTAADRSVITDLSHYQLEFSEAIPSVDQINSLTQQVAVAQQDVCSTLSGKKQLSIYLTKMNDLYAAKLNQFAYEQFGAFCSNANVILTEKNNAIFDIVSDLLRQMMPIFENYGSIKTTAIKTDTTLSWTMVDTPAFIRELEKRMAEKPEFAVNLRQVVQNFYSYLFDNIDKWKDENQDAVEDLNTFIYRQFNTILNNSMDFFLEIIANSEGKTLTEYCDSIIAELKQKAAVCYPIDSAFMSGAVTQPGYSFISVPDNSPQLLEAASAAAMTASTEGGAPSLVKASGVRDRIFMMTFMSATPLSLNADIKQFYTLYMQSRDSQEGLHLYTPTKVGKRVSDTNWKDLPAPYPETEWVNFEDLKDRDTNAHYREVLKKALDYGYVKQDVKERTMTLYYGEPIDLDAIAEKYSIDLSGDETIKKQAARQFVAEVTALLKAENIPARCDKPLVRSDMVEDVDGTLKESYAEIIFIQMYRPRQRIEAMVKNHEEALAAIEKVRSLVVDEGLVENFVKCRITKQVDRHPKKQGVFVYFDRHGAAIDLITLVPRQVKHQEYYIMKSFMALSAQARDVLDKRAQSILDSGDGLDRIIKALEAYKEKMIDSKLEDLNWDYADMEDGAKILDAYNNLSKSSKDLLDLLKMSNGESEEEDFGF